MATLLTLVGLQPAAVAATAKTLARRQPLHQVALFHTSKTAPVAARLQQFLATLKPAPRVLCRQIAVSEGDATAPQPWEAIRIFLEKPGLPEPIYYDLSPGLNFQVAQIAFHLGQDVRLQPLYGTYKEVINLATGERWHKENIGLAPLLRLYGLQTEPPLNQLPEEGFVTNLTITVPGQNKLILEYATEYKGYLHILARCWRKDRKKPWKNSFSPLVGALDQEVLPPPRRSKNELYILKQRTRQLAAIVENPARLNHLHPVLTVATNDLAVARRLQSYGIRCFFLVGNQQEADKLAAQGLRGFPETTKITKIWKQLRQEPPGVSRPDPEEPCLDLTPGPVAIQSQPVAAESWQGPPLVTALGNDPTATLIALCTHQPREAILLVDRETPWLGAMASRLAAQIAQLGVQQLTFWSVDLSGQIEQEDSFLARLTADPATIWHINISPGSKAQAWRLSLMARQHANIQLWSLHQGQSQAVPLFSYASVAPLPLQHPPILLEVACRRGPDFDYELTLNDLQARKDCLIKMMLILSHLSVPSGVCLPNNFTWQPDIELPLDNTSGIRCLAIKDQGKKKIFKFLVRYRRQECEVEYPSYIGTGYWLEPLVAVAFLNASTSREPYVLEDLVTGLRLYQTKGKIKTPLVEIDVILYWQQQHIAVSCKSGKIEETDRQEIITEARRTLGRFALPVLVRGGIPHARAKEVAEASIHREPLEIGLSLLKDAGYLRDLIERALQAKRTTAPSPASRGAP